MCLLQNRFTSAMSDSIATLWLTTLRVVRSRIGWRTTSRIRALSKSTAGTLWVGAAADSAWWRLLGIRVRSRWGWCTRAVALWLWRVAGCTAIRLKWLSRMRVSVWAGVWWPILWRILVARRAVRLVAGWSLSARADSTRG